MPKEIADVEAVEIETPPTTPETDPFADAFASYSVDEGEAPAAQPTKPEDQDTAPEGGELEQEGDEGDQEGDEGTELEQEDEDDVPAPEDKMSDDDLLARFANLVKRADPKPEPDPAPKQEQTAPEQPALYTEDEQALIRSYEEEWGDVSRAESLKRRGEYRMVVDYVFKEVQKVLQPLMQDVDTLSSRTHLSDLRGQVDDYEDIRDKVVTWAEQQPAYLQEAYNRVITSGTVEEVTDLIARFRADTGTKPTQQQKPAAPAVQQQKPKKDAELPTVAKQAAAALAPVRSKRATVPQGEDLGDFDTAFAQFAASSKL